MTDVHIPFMIGYNATKVIQARKAKDRQQAGLPPLPPQQCIVDQFTSMFKSRPTQPPAHTTPAIAFGMWKKLIATQ